MKEQRGKAQVSFFLYAVFVFGAGILILLASSTFLKNWITIGFGIRVLNIVKLIGGGITAIGVVMFIIYGILLTQMARRNKAAQEKMSEREKLRSQVLADYAGDSSNPEFTRKRLEHLQSEMPGIDELIEVCLRQMDTMDKLQAKQEVLIEANDARYLRDTVAVLNNVEQRICRNFRNVINLCIAADDAEYIDMKKVRKSLDDNEKKLEDAKKLLKVSAEWINQYNADSNSDRSEVENWIAVIRESLKEDEV